MHTVELLDLAVAAARRLGYRVRHEWLDGGGGACEIRGQKWLFLDLSRSAAEQLEQALDALRDQPHLMPELLAPPLRQAVFRKIA